MVKYNDIDTGRSGTDKKLLKGRKSVKKSKNLKGLKSPKGHRFGGTFTKLPILCQLDMSFFYSSDSFSGSFAKFKSFLDTTFGAIIVKAKLIVLLMLCHVFPNRKKIFKPRTLEYFNRQSLYNEFLSAKLTSFLRYFNSGDALRKKTAQPKIRTEMLDRLGGCRGSCALPRNAIDTKLSTNLYRVSYDPILVLADRLKKILRDEPMQMNDAPGLAKVFIDLIVQHPNFPTQCQ